MKILIMMYVTPTLIKPDKSLLMRFDLISRIAKQDTEDCSEQECLARRAAQCCGALFRANLEGQILIVR